jgi:hypothetical protein
MSSYEKYQFHLLLKRRLLLAIIYLKQGSVVLGSMSVLGAESGKCL